MMPVVSCALLLLMVAVTPASTSHPSPEGAQWHREHPAIPLSTDSGTASHERVTNPGLEYRSPLYDRHLWIALVVSVVVSLSLISAVALWNRSLKSQVDERTRALQGELLQRKQVEEALRESQQNYRQLVECANAIILTVDVDGTILYFNEYAQRFFGYTAEEVIGRNVLGTIVPHTESTGRDLGLMLRDIFTSPENHYTNENENITRNGERRWVSWSNRPLRTADGSLAQVLCVGTDVTQRRQAAAALEESEHRYRFLFDESPACNIILCADGTIRDVNNVFLRRLGYQREEVVGKNAFDFIPENARRRLREVLLRRFAGETAGIDTDTPMIAHDAQIRYINFAAGQAPVTADTGEPALLISGIDVTQKHLVEEQERQHQEKLIQTDKMTTLGVLVSGVAHEINNPNNYIRLNSENLADIWAELEPLAHECLQAHADTSVRGFSYEELTGRMGSMIRGITEGADRIAAIVTSLKNFAREEPGALTQEVDINRVVESSLLILSNMIKNATDRFTVTYGKEIGCLRGNFQRVEQVVINVISNGCQALADKRRGLWVETAALPQTGQIRVTVRDEGTGIPSHVMKRIFDPFFTTRRESGGTGLGLPIAYRIMKDHGGELLVASTTESGTTVTLLFPAASGAGPQRSA